MSESYFLNIIEDALPSHLESLEAKDIVNVCEGVIHLGYNDRGRCDSLYHALKERAGNMLITSLSKVRRYNYDAYPDIRFTSSGNTMQGLMRSLDFIISGMRLDKSPDQIEIYLQGITPLKYQDCKELFADVRYITLKYVGGKWKMRVMDLKYTSQGFGETVVLDKFGSSEGRTEFADGKVFYIKKEKDETS